MDGCRYFLAMSSCQPLYGKLSDIFGRKPCVLMAYSVFAVGSLACGLAQSMGQFIAARVSITFLKIYANHQLLNVCMRHMSLFLPMIYFNSSISTVVLTYTHYLYAVGSV